jgi:hypothetical protein
LLASLSPIVALAEEGVVEVEEVEGLDMAGLVNAGLWSGSWLDSQLDCDWAAILWESPSENLPWYLSGSQRQPSSGLDVRSF